MSSTTTKSSRKGSENARTPNYVWFGFDLDQSEAGMLHADTSRSKRGFVREDNRGAATT